MPATAQQLIIFLLFVLPGFTYQAVRARLKGPAPDDASATNRVLRALGVSALLASLYAVAFGPYLVHLSRAYPLRPGAGQGLLAHPRQTGALALGLVFAVPALLAGLDYLRLRRGWTLKLTYDPTPRAWDFAFRDIKPTYVRILTTDGIWLGGWYGEDSFVSSYPEPREIFIQAAHRMREDGTIGAEQSGSDGLYVRCDDIRSVEFVDGRRAQEQTGVDQLVTGRPEVLEEGTDGNHPEQGPVDRPT